MEAAGRILKQLGVELHPQKTRIVHVRYGFEFLGYKIKRGKKSAFYPKARFVAKHVRVHSTRTRVRSRSNDSMDQVRQRTKRKSASEDPGADCET